MSAFHFRRNAYCFASCILFPFAGTACFFLPLAAVFFFSVSFVVSAPDQQKNPAGNSNTFISNNPSEKLFRAPAGGKIQKTVNGKAEGGTAGRKEGGPNKRSDKGPVENRLKCRGVIVKFHSWPSAEDQKEIADRLKSVGLKKTKSIKSFKTQLFEWSEGGLKPSSRGIFTLPPKDLKFSNST